MTQDDVFNAQVIAQLEARNKETSAQLADTQKSFRVVLYSLASVLIVVPIVAAVFYKKFPLVQNFYTDNAKAICEAQAYETPLVTTNTVTEFAKDCALDIDTFGYDDVERNLGRMSERCLLPGFRQKFFTASWLSNRINTVKQGLYRVNSQTTGPVLVQSEALTPDGYMWRVEVPIKRHFRQGDAPKGINERVYVMDVYRVRKDAFNPVGLGINAINEMSPKR